MIFQSLVSVIIPTYNCSQYICKAIVSIKNQTYDNLEIIVVDDGSEDSTRQVIEELNDRAIRYIYQHNQGVAQARNTGILAARGEYIAYVDADDEIDEKTLQTCYEAVIRDRTEWCITDILRIRESETGRNEVIARSPVPEKDLVYNILIDDFVLRAPFFRRDTLISMGLYDVRLLAREDWDLSIRLIRAKRQFSYIPKPFYRYHFRSNSLMRKSKQLSYDCTLIVLHKHHRQLADDGDSRAASIYAESLWWLGRNYFIDEQCYLRFAYCLKESISYDFNVKLYSTTLINLIKKCMAHFRK